MGELLLLLPGLFLAICISFIIVQTCYHRWKASNIWRRKRDAAKISLVNILQMTNSNLTAPWLSRDGEEEYNPSSSPNNDPPVRDKCTACTNQKHSDTFDPRYPNILSSIVTMRDDNSPPPCYDELYGGKEENPGVPFPPGGYTAGLPPYSVVINPHCHNDSQLLTIPIETGNASFGFCTEPHSVLSSERRNSSAVLYL